MKKVFTFLAAVILTTSAFAQSPQKMTYQAVIRKSGNQLVTNSQIGMEINIRQGSPTGTIVYTETQTPTTNANGLVNIEIGGEAGFIDINWANGPYFLETKTAVVLPLTTYTIIGTSQLLSVPYALYSKTAEKISGGITESDPVFTSWNKDYNDLTNKPNVKDTVTAYGFSGNYDYLTNKPNIKDTVTAYGFSGNYDYLTNKPNVKDTVTAYGFSGNYDNLTNKPNIKDTITAYSFSGNYNNLTNKPNVKDTVTAYGFNGNYDNLTNKPNVKDTVKVYGFSGNYDNLTNKPKGATYRWATFTTYEQSAGWACGNTASLFGGVSPSSWTDGGYRADQMSSDKEVLRTLFTQKGYAGKNAMIMNEDWMSYSSSNGKVVIVLFRIKNNTSTALMWTPSFYYSAYGAWSEVASVAINGSGIFIDQNSGSKQLNMTLPANRVSTVIFVSTSGAPLGNMRNCRLAFYNDCLSLPNGLEFVDDLDYAQGD